MNELPRVLRWYLWAIYIFTFVYVSPSIVMALMAPANWQHPARLILSPVFLYGMLFIAILYLGEHTTLYVTGGISQSLSTAVHIAAILLFPAPFPMLVTLVAVAASQLPQRGRAMYKRIFNICHPTLTVSLSSILYRSVISPHTVLRAGNFVAAIPHMLALIGCYYLLDVALLLIVISLVDVQPFWLIWWQTYRLTLLPELSASTIGVLTAITWEYDKVALSLVILPLVSLRFAFRAIAQAQDRAAALRRRSQQLEAVLKAGQQLRLQHAQADLLNTMAEAAQTLAGAKTVAGYLRDPESPARLERIVVVPHDSGDSGPIHIAVSDVKAGVTEEPEDTGRTLMVPLELESEGMEGMLRLVGVPDDFTRDDEDALAILATQASIALHNALLHKLALAQASTDGLTGLANHKTFQTRLEEEVVRATRAKHELTVIMADLDDFKTVNNMYGHQTGDAILKAVADSLRASVRFGDVPARYGGDEFAIILPETSIAEGIEIAERVRSSVSSHIVMDTGSTIRISASIGAASLHLHANSREGLIRAADQAAYAAKHTGKARVCRPEDAVLKLDRDPVILAQRLENANMATVEALAAAVDAKDPYTRGHAHRVSAYAAAIANAMRLSVAEIATVRLSGLLHDVGKIGIPDAILTKAGQLTVEEFAITKQHSVIGERMLSQVPFLHEILPAVRHHHERWDGDGYPDGLAGTAIPRSALILMVADAFDAMTSSRTYRAALPLAEAVRRMRQCSGTQFDPSVVAAFERVMGEGGLTLRGTSDTGSAALVQVQSGTDRETGIWQMEDHVAALAS